MNLAALLGIALASTLLAAPLAHGGKLRVKTDQVVDLTRLLEEKPLDESAPAIRSLLIDWEKKSKDVVDYVCPGVLTPILAADVPNSAELLVQFIFGSAAHQIGNPSDKGKVVPGQLAGMRSMLKAYRAFLVANPAARIPRLDELTQMNAAGTLPEYLEPIVVKECGQGS
ncbi:hypothetical protein [Xanthomonas arboricola]|uniref:hypothetical protein n=1 Tax=Xanthomonas arboricola TaxID=56448 RepID=UPI00160E1BF1|nr:hypothetical protein [Xanthomonas arboricola]MBB4597640.1 hypothetical protein [Xanthomonas arboricola]